MNIIIIVSFEISDCSYVVLPIITLYTSIVLVDHMHTHFLLKKTTLTNVYLQYVTQMNL